MRILVVVLVEMLENLVRFQIMNALSNRKLGDLLIRTADAMEESAFHRHVRFLESPKFLPCNLGHALC